MRVITLIILLFLKTVYGFAQTVDGKDSVAYHKIWIGATDYSFAYNSEFNSGTTALGISLYIPADRFIFQIALLMDLRHYDVAETLRYNGAIGNTTINHYKETQSLIPILLHYTFAKTEKINYFLTAGIILSGNYYLNKENEVIDAGSGSWIAGAGISYNLLKRIYLRAEPTIRFNGAPDTEERIFFPGILIDIAYDVSFKETKRP